MSHTSSAATLGYNVPITDVSPPKSSPRLGSAGNGSARSTGPILPPMAQIPAADTTQQPPSLPSSRSGKRPSQLAGLESTGSLPSLPPVGTSTQQQQTSSTGQLEPLPFAPRFDPAYTAPAPFQPFPPTAFAPFASGQFYAPQGPPSLYSAAPGVTFDPYAMPLSTGTPETPDPFSAQLANRRYNLMIRAAPATSGGSHRPAKKKGQPLSLDAADLAASGSGGAPGAGGGSMRRPHFLNDAQQRNHARLQKMFGANSTYAKRQRRQKAQEEAAALALQSGRDGAGRSTNTGKRGSSHTGLDNHPSDPHSPRSPHKGSEEKHQAQDVAAAQALQSHEKALLQAQQQQQAAAAQQEKQNATTTNKSKESHQRHKKKILAFLTSHPSKHHFWDHLPGRPVVTEKHVDRIYEEVGSAAIQHLRILESHHAQFDSIQDLLNSIVQSELMEKENRDSDRNRELALEKGFHMDSSEFSGPDGTAHGTEFGGFKTEQDRAIASVLPRDRERLVAYLTSTPLQGTDGRPDSILLTNPLDGSVTTQVVPEQCHLFGESEFVSATPRELNELIVEGGGIEKCLEKLIQLDQVSGRCFDNFSQLLFAIHVSQLDQEVAQKTKTEMLEYFKRGEELQKKEQQRRQNKQAQQQKKGGGSTHRGVDHEEKDESFSSPTGAHTDRSHNTKGGKNRAGVHAGPPTCHLFLHLSTPTIVTQQDVDRIYDESTAGRDTMLHLKSFEQKGMKLSGIQALIDALLEAHMSYLRKNKLYMISFAATSKQDRNEVLKEINSPECTLFVSNKKDATGTGTTSSTGAIHATSDEVAILISECQSLQITLSYIHSFSRRNLTFPDMESCIFELKFRHAKAKKELLRFFRSSSCRLFRTKEEDERDGVDPDSLLPTYEDPSLYTMSLMDRLIIESHLESIEEIFTYLIQLNNDSLIILDNFQDLISLLQSCSERTKKQRAISKTTLLEFLGSAQCHLLPRELQLFETDVSRLWQAGGGDDTLVLIYFLNDTKHSYSSVEELIGAVRDEARNVPQQKQELFQHFLSKHSNLFEQVAWDVSFQPGGKESSTNATQRVNYAPQLQAALPKRLSTASARPSAPNDKGANKGSMSLYQLVEEAAAAETRARLAVLTGNRDIDAHGRMIVAGSSTKSIPSTSTAETFGTEFTQGLSVWTAPTMALPSNSSTGVIKLTPSEISRLYRQSLAGPLTLTYLWKLEVSHSRFFSMDDLLVAVKNMHEEQRVVHTTERHLLISDLLQQQNSFLFSHPIRVSEAEVEGLLTVFNSVAPTLFHLHHLRSIERQYNSFAELEAEMKLEKKSSEQIQRDVLQYLRHPLCHLLSPEVLLNMDTCARIFYESQTGFSLPFYLQILDGRSGGKMDLEEQRRRLRQYERSREIGQGLNTDTDSSSAQQLAPEERTSKFSSITELVLALKKLKNDMTEVEARCLAFLNTGRGTSFFQENQQQKLALSKTMKDREERARVEREQDTDAQEGGVYTIGGTSRRDTSQALTVQNQSLVSSPSFGASPAFGAAQQQQQGGASKVWTVYEVSRLMIEGEGGIDTCSHLVALQQEHLAFRNALAEGQLAAQSQAKAQGATTREQIESVSSEEAVIAALGLTPPPVYSTLEDLIARLQSMQRTLVQQRNQDKSVVHAFVSQAPAVNALMSAQFHAANHMRRGGARESIMSAGPDFHSPALALIPSDSSAAGGHVPSELDLLGASSGAAPTVASDALDLGMQVPEALASVRCIWHSEEIDQLYEVGQGSAIGPATLLYLVELEATNRHTGRKFHSVAEVLEALRQIKVQIAKRKQDILEYLLEYAPRFWAKKSATNSSTTTGSNSPRSKKYAAATKVAKAPKVDTRIMVRGGGGALGPRLTLGANLPASEQPFFIPTLEDVHTLYEHAGAGVSTLEILKDLELEVVGRRPFQGMDDLISAVNAEFVRRAAASRSKERELESFLSNPLGCPLFSTPQVFQRSSVQFLVGCAGSSAAAAVFFVQQLLEASVGARKMNNILDLLRAVREKREEQDREQIKIHSFLTTPPGKSLLYGFASSSAASAAQQVGTLHMESVARLYIEGGAGSQTLNYLQNYVLNQKTFLPMSETADGALSALIKELARTKSEEADEFKLLKQKVFSYLRREKGSEIEGALCDLFSDETITSSFQHSKLVQPSTFADQQQQQTSTAMVLANTGMKGQTANEIHIPSSSSIPAGLTYNDINHLFHTAQSGKYTLEYLHTFNMELRSFSTFDSLVSALKVYHDHMQGLKGQIYAFFVSPSEHARARAVQAAGLPFETDVPHPPCHLFEASPYEIQMNSEVVDQIMTEGRCGEDTLSYLYGFEASHHAFQTIQDLIEELQTIYESKKSKLHQHKQKILEFISSPECQLFRQAIQITDYHLELLVEAGRKSIVSSVAPGSLGGGSDAASSPKSSRVSPSAATVGALSYLNSSLHWFSTPKALVIGVRHTLAEIMDARRRTFKWLNNLHLRAGGSNNSGSNTNNKRRAIASEEEECSLWDRPTDILSPEASIDNRKALAVSGRAGKAKRAAGSNAALRFTSDELNTLFEESGSGPETFENILRMAALRMRFSSASDLISSAQQFHILNLKHRRDLLSFLQQPSGGTIFSKCPQGYVFLLTLTDCKHVLDSLEIEQLQEEDDHQEERKRQKAGLSQAGQISGSGGNTAATNQIGSQRSYLATLLPLEPTSINDLVSYPYESRVLRLLKELGEIGKKVYSFAELLHVLQQASFEWTQREESLLNFLNDSRCKFFATLTASLPQGQKPWNRFHVRRLLQEVAMYNSDGTRATREAQARAEQERVRNGSAAEEKYPSSDEKQSEYSDQPDIPALSPQRADPGKNEESYIGLGDCLLLLWNLNASGRTFHSFGELVQALKTEYLLASEFVSRLGATSGAASGGASERDEAVGHSELGTGSKAAQAVSLVALKVGAEKEKGEKELLVPAPTYLDTLALHTVTYAGQPRSTFSWDSIELEFLFHVSYLSPGLLTAALKIKYLEWQNGKQALLHFFKRKNNPIFTISHGGAGSADQLQQTLNFLQTESGINTLWYGSGAREYSLNYLGILITQQRSFESLKELMKTLKSMHRKRLLQTKLQAILQTYDSSIARVANEFIEDSQRQIVLDFLESEQSTIFRPSSLGGNKDGKIPGQEPLQIEKDPYALPLLPPPQVKHIGVNLSKQDIDEMIYTSGHSLNLLMLYLRYLSKFSRTFSNIEELLPVLKQLHHEHIEMCKLTLKFFYQSDCLLLNHPDAVSVKGQPTPAAGGGTILANNQSSQQLLLLTSGGSSSGDLPHAALTRAEQDDAEIMALDLRGLNGGGSSSGVDLNLNDMSLLLREATGGLPALPHLHNFDAQRARFRSFAHLLAATREAQRASESEQSVNLHKQKYIDACHAFLASPWTGLFTDTVHSKPILPTEQEFSSLLQACSGSSTALLLHLHVFNQQGRKFRSYAELQESLLLASEEAMERKNELFAWLRSTDNKLFSHAADLPDGDHVAGDQQSQSIRPSGGIGGTAKQSSQEDKPFQWTWEHVSRLFEETDAAGDTLSHLYTLNTLGARFYKFSALLDAVTEQHEKLKVTRAEAVLAARKKEGKALIRSYLIDPATHLFAVPVQIHDGHITQLYEVGEQGETAVGIRLLGKRTRPGAATVHCLQSLEAMRPATTDKFSSYPELYQALQGAAINLIIERSESIGLGEVAHKPPEVLSGAAGAAVATSSSILSPTGNSTQLSLASISGVQPFLLSAQDKQLLLDHLSSPACTLFAALASSPVRQTLAIRTSDLQAIVQAAGDGANAIALLKRLDNAGKQFESFEALVYAVKVEALARPPPSTLAPEQMVSLLAYLSKSFLLYDRTDLSHKLSKADLLKLLDCSGKSLENVLCNLQDLSENQSQLIPSITWSSFLEKVELNWNALARLKREVLAYLINVERDLFAAKPAETPLNLTLAAMDPFFVQTGAGTHTLTYLLSFSRAGQTFASMQELTVSVRSAHLATQNIKSSELESQKSKILDYLSTSQHIKQLFIPVAPPADAPPSAAQAPSIAVTDIGLREMLKLAGSANATIQLLNVLYDRGLKVKSFNELLDRFRQEICRTYN